MKSWMRNSRRESLVDEMRSRANCATRTNKVANDTKLTIHFSLLQSIFGPTIMSGNESGVPNGHLMHDLEVADVHVVRMIARAQIEETHLRIVSEIMKPGRCWMPSRLKLLREGID